MRPKDKAKELFDKYCHALRTEEDDDGYFSNVVHAKRCAIIAVDEMISNSDFNFQNPNKNTIYWLTVKQEIKNL
jgi:hypothetical protein